MGKSRKPVLVPFHPTRRNTVSDRKPGCGSVAALAGRRHPALKKGGVGCANWGREGDETEDCDDYKYDCTAPSVAEALATAAGLRWAEVDGLSDEDESNMAALEEGMREVWLCDQEAEANQQIQDEGEDFFNSLDPNSWVDY